MDDSAARMNVNLEKIQMPARSGWHRRHLACPMKPTISRSRMRVPAP